MKALILAGGKGSRSGVDYPKVLQKLGEKRVIDHILEKAKQFLDPSDIYIVVGYQKEAIIDYLGASYNYINQEEQLGTAHAALQATEELRNWSGTLLVLYGDTPLFRQESIRGLINYHQQKGPALTIFTAFLEDPPPYGRVVRDDEGRITSVIEEFDASTSVKEIKEINIGAYVAEWPEIVPSLRELERDNEQDEYLFTDVVKELTERDLNVHSYRTFDSDEILGINTPEDLDTAEFILQKRTFRPFQREEKNIIEFGTGGWRGIIGEGFTFDNVRRLAQAIANNLIREGKEDEGVIIGFGRRFLSNRFAEAFAEVLAGNNVKTTVLPESSPTPVIVYATQTSDHALGIMVTASHNPAKYNGIKIRAEEGKPMPDSKTHSFAEEANSFDSQEVVKADYSSCQKADYIKEREYSNSYIDAVEEKIDMDSIRSADMHVILDPMHGVGQVTLETILTECRCKLNTIHDRHDPLFGGQSPSPDLSSLTELTSLVQEESYDLGLATDGDADRIAVIDERGEYVSANDILTILYYYLHEYRKLSGGVVRNLATTHKLDRLAQSFGEECIEVPVGFKHIYQAMNESGALLGGESSGGLTVRDHIPGKDGVFAAALIVELLAKSGKSLSDFQAELKDITGELYTYQENIEYQGEMKATLTKQFKERDLEEIAGHSVEYTTHKDGVKYFLENDNWALLRFSGTEPLLRLRAEGTTKSTAKRLVKGLYDKFELDTLEGKKIY
ncbi:NTP transferase domain-containing protein [Candidatus Bipolaricaulota bacterium]|nr:NTP transferase domain-containing protein [Candidatus Bipolaricaulota bacterium]